VLSVCDSLTAERPAARPAGNVKPFVELKSISLECDVGCVSLAVSNG